MPLGKTSCQTRNLAATSLSCLARETIAVEEAFVYVLGWVGCPRECISGLRFANWLAAMSELA